MTSPPPRSQVFDLARARRETPSCQRLMHFNNAGAALMPDPVYSTVIDHLALEREIGGYEAVAACADAVAAVPRDVAQLIGAKTSEVAITDSATRAWSVAFAAMRLRKGHRILTTRSEYASNFIAYLQAEQRYGVKIEIVPDDEHGAISLDRLADTIGPDVDLVSINHAPTQNGLVNPAVEVGRIARAAGVPFLLDACQTVGQLPVDVGMIGCDMLTATGRKFLRGPRGTGFLFVRDDFMDRLNPWPLDLHSADWTGAFSFSAKADARRFEYWEFDHAARLGLGAAARYARNWGLEAISMRVQGLAADLRRSLGEIRGVRVRDRGALQSGIVTFTAEGVDPFDLQLQLRSRKINVSVSKARSARIDFEGADYDACVRASIHYYNTSAEIEAFTSVLDEIVFDSQS